MEEPTFTAYVTLIFTLFDRFIQAHPTWGGHEQVVRRHG